MNEQCEQPTYFNELNPPQREAVAHFEGPILVLAGAGSGKTRVLTHRIVHLVLAHHVHPREILAVTFTNKATQEMRERLRKLLGDADAQLWVTTFHSAALRILRRHAPLLSYKNDFVVYDEQDSKSAMKEVIQQLNVDSKRFAPESFLQVIDQAKNAMVLPAEMHKKSHDFAARLKAEVYDAYQRTLLQANAMDFGDLLLNATLLLRDFKDIRESYQRSLRFVLVDEYQDTNKVQYEFLRLLVEHRQNLFVVGDDDQSIYRFRGATLKNILEFEKDFPAAKVVRLEQNYRSSGNILDAAHSVIKHNSGRKGKKLWTAGEKGPPICAYAGWDDGDEAFFIGRQIKALLRQGFKYRDTAVFYRTNAQSRAIEEVLMAEEIPYRIYGGLKFYQRKEIKDIIAYLRLIVNEADNQAFYRIINTPARGIGAQSCKVIADSAAQESVSQYAAACALCAKSKNLSAFVSLIGGLKDAAAELPLHRLIRETIVRSGYEDYLKSAGKDPAAQSRIENLQELEGIGFVMEVAGEPPMDTLKRFLDRVCLATSDELPVEDLHDKSALEKGQTRPDTVSLMTLHLAKGLEFPVVFLSGFEEGLLPHMRSINSPDEIEEERRLCYVGITRAMKHLYLTRAKRRALFSSAHGGGGYPGMLRLPSRFAHNLPEDKISDAGGDFFGENSWDSENSLDDIAVEETIWRRRRRKSNDSEAAGVVVADKLKQRRSGDS